ncbi:calcium-activated chloride channel regulator 1 [Trichonephila clavipes]|uniref:Calcium-activated chloride channel regulator 1 n=1 Tax=Trichonephila clavipes TaxID=2585209 RepID=A0A8X7BBC2_TRICX|nr:calcium-activated chloride channel regulator 1 [Trichonephila clavipes]
MLVRIQQELLKTSYVIFRLFHSDLSPVEHVWDQLKRQMPSRHSVHDLELAVQDLWAHLSQDNIRNAAPKFFADISLSFRFVKEIDAPKVIVAIDISSKMTEENRYALIKNAFSHFVLNILPSGSELSLITFGGDGNYSLITSSLVLTDDASKIRYLEGQPLPEEPLDEENSCLHCVLEDIIELTENENSTFNSAPNVILLTTTQYIDPERYDAIQLSLQQSEMRLTAMVFQNNSPPQSMFTDLCSKSGNQLVYVGSDPLKDMYRSFVQAIGGHRSMQLFTALKHIHLLSSPIGQQYTSAGVHTTSRSTAGSHFSQPPLRSLAMLLSPYLMTQNGVLVNDFSLMGTADHKKCNTKKDLRYPSKIYLADNMLYKYQMIEITTSCEVWIMTKSAVSVAAILGYNRCSMPQHSSSSATRLLFFLRRIQKHGQQTLDVFHEA